MGMKMGGYHWCSMNAKDCEAFADVGVKCNSGYSPDLLVLHMARTRMISLVGTWDCARPIGVLALSNK